MIFQKIIWEMRLRKPWDKLLDRPENGNAKEKGEPKTVRSAKRWYSDLEALDQLTRYNGPPLQPVCPTKISLARYGLGDTSKGGFRSGLSMKKERSDGM